MLQENNIRSQGDTPADTISERRGLDAGAIMMIIDALEQGVVVWSGDGTCLAHNQQAIALLGLDRSHLAVGTKLDDFFHYGRDRGEFSAEKMRECLDLFAIGRAFRYDCMVPGDTILSVNVRPVRGGGQVMVLTDVTDTRQANADLAKAEAEAIEAQRKADEILQDERGRQREASMLAQMDEWLQSCKSLAELYAIVTAFMQKVLPGSRGQLFIYSNSRDVLELACAWNCTNPPHQVAPDSCWALRRGRSYRYDPNTLSFVCDHVKVNLGDGEEPEDFTCLPIVAHGDTVGLIHIEFLKEADNPDVLDVVQFTKRCAEHISMAIANVKLRDELQDQSTRDPLTGLYNRRHFLEALRREIINTASRQGNFALLALDADNFKKLNDDHGHDAGDVVLEAIAEKMFSIELDGAVACRVGGEEFSLILPTADRSRATAIAEDLRQTIEDTRVKYIGGPLPKVTISIGIAVYPTHGTDPQNMIKQADIALYDAKNAGRNCWRIPDGADLITFD